MRSFLLFFLVSYSFASAQVDSMTVLKFDFNDQAIKENDNKVKVRSVNVSLTKDRFGNNKSAVFLQGSAQSYLSLGKSPLLKAKVTTISMWVNLNRYVTAGRGYPSNPIYNTKNRAFEDFNAAYGFGLDGVNRRYHAASTKDSTREALVSSKAPIDFKAWHHLVLAADNNYLSFYLDGVLQGKAYKGFETVFYENDSATIGHTGSKKNLRFSQGTFDDIRIFHRVLSEKEILDLYNEPDPNRINIIMVYVWKAALCLIAIILIAFLLVANRRRSLKREQERFELKRKMTEMEIRVIKAQINPHFMSNCLAAVQHLIINNKNEAANSYLAKFAFIVRQVLNFSTRSLVTLREELEIVTLNIDLEQLRFEDKFEFSMHIAPGIDTDGIHMPPLILQPVVENAIWHGLLPLEAKRKATLHVSVENYDHILKVVIEDNGVGRKQKVADIGNSRDSKGIKITTQRIENLNNLYEVKTAQIIYTDLTDAENKPAGTRVTIFLPDSLEADPND